MRELLSACVDVQAYAKYFCALLEDGGDVRPILESVLESPADVAAVATQLERAYQASMISSSVTTSLLDFFDDFGDCDIPEAALDPSGLELQGPKLLPPALPEASEPPSAGSGGGSASSTSSIKPDAPLAHDGDVRVRPSNSKLRGVLRGSRTPSSASASALKAELLAGFSTGFPSQQAPANTVVSAGGGITVCRYFVSGGCYMRNCAFSHSLGGVPCRYFLSPEGCTRPDCTFWHPPLLGATTDASFLASSTLPASAAAAAPFHPPQGLADDDEAQGALPGSDMFLVQSLLSASSAGQGIDDENLGLWLLEWLEQHPDAAASACWDDALASAGTGRLAPEPPQPEPFDKDDEGLFPALPQATGPRQSSSSDRGGPGRAPIRKVSEEPFDPASLAALLASKIRFAAPPGGGYGAGGRQPATGAGDASAPAQRAPPSRGAAAHERTARGIAESLEWVDTGESVAALYRDLRAGAEALAKARNLAFHRATSAFLAGRSVDAARMARQGRDLQAQMQQAHAIAAGAIFAARNSAHGVAGVGRAPLAPGGTSSLPAPATVTMPPHHGGGTVAVRVFDLHGLHPSEAADVVGGILGVLGSLSPALAGDAAWLAFLTGTRHHSRRLGKGGGSIQEAVVAALRGVEAFTPAAHGRSAASSAGVVVARWSAAAASHG